MNDTTPTTDRWTREGHQRFKAAQRFKCGDGKTRTWDEWMTWQATRDPITENPLGAKRFRRETGATS